MAKSEGAGSAENAQAQTTEDEGGFQEDPTVVLKARVEGAKARVDKLEEHLEGAKQALADAESALKEGN